MKYSIKWFGDEVLKITTEFSSRLPSSKAPLKGSSVTDVPNCAPECELLEQQVWAKDVTLRAQR